MFENSDCAFVNTKLNVLSMSNKYITFCISYAIKVNKAILVVPYCISPENSQFLCVFFVTNFPKIRHGEVFQWKFIEIRFYFGLKCTYQWLILKICGRRPIQWYYNNVLTCRSCTWWLRTRLDDHRLDVLLPYRRRPTDVVWRTRRLPQSRFHVAADLLGRCTGYTSIYLEMGNDTLLLI